MVVNQVSKTARPLESGQPVIGDAKLAKMTAAKHLNRDLIASTEKINDFSPKNGGSSHAGGSSTLQSSQHGASLNGTAPSRTSNNQSQYLAKLQHDSNGAAMDSLKGKSQLRESLAAQ